MACIICDSDREKYKFRYMSTNFYQCQGCGLIRTLPFPSEEQINTHYLNKFVKGNYRTMLQNMEMYKEQYRKYIRLIQGHTGSLAKKKILDIGCFTGEFLDIAREKGAITYGIEFQNEAASIASEKHDNRVKNCSLSDAEFDERFDVVTLFGLIEHLTDPQVLLKQITKWVIDGGLIVIQTPNTGSAFSCLLGKLWPPYTPVEHIHYFSHKNIRVFLEKFDLKILQIIPHYKRLSIQYVYNMLRNFGPEFHRIFSPVYSVLPQALRQLRLSFYIGEMIVVAQRKSEF